MKKTVYIHRKVWYNVYIKQLNEELKYGTSS